MNAINSKTPPEPKKKWVTPDVEIICTAHIAGGQHVGGPETIQTFPKTGVPGSSTAGTHS